MTQTQVAEAPKIKRPVQMDENTYFVVMFDDHEAKIAREYLKSLYPESLAKVVKELRLDRLTDKHAVITLTRGNERTPAVHVVTTATGMRVPQPSPPDALITEVSECKPVRCADYWVPAREGNDGELNLAGFLEELGKRCSPAAIKYYPQNNTLKLGF